MKTTGKAAGREIPDPVALVLRSSHDSFDLFDFRHEGWVVVLEASKDLP
jgi:hypothetical protein